VYVVDEKWGEAENADRKLSTSSDSTVRSVGHVNLANDALYHGQMARALKEFEVAIAGQGAEGSSQTALARNAMANVLLATGQPAQALEQAQRALVEARNGGAEWTSLYLTALAQSRLGRRADAAKTVEELTRRANALPSDREKRRVHTLSGVLALDSSDPTRAIAELTQAEAMLAPLSFHVIFARPPDCVPIWFALGSANLATGHLAEAQAASKRSSARRQPGSTIRSSSSAACTSSVRSRMVKAIATKPQHIITTFCSTGPTAKSIATRWSRRRRPAQAASCHRSPVELILLFKTLLAER
jgi:tetratricopeptide (TPR) repeat protein